MIRLLICLLITSFLTACNASSEPAADEPPAETPTSDATPLLVRASPTPTPTDRPPPTQLPTATAELTILNASEADVCDVAITPSAAEELGDNVLDEALLPRTIYETAQGNFELLDLLAAETGIAWHYPFQRQVGAEDRSDSEGMFNSVTCHDEYAFGLYHTAEERALAEIPEGLQSALFGTVRGLFETCSFWGAGQADPEENEAVVSNVPTLILAGQFDPVTPPGWGRLAATSLSQAYFYELPGYGHSLSSDPGCPTEIIAQFLAEPAAAPDSGCIDNLGPPNFYLPDEPLDF